MLIVFEGVDGSGKATQAKLLKDFLISKGFETSLLSFPNYETSVGSHIKQLLNQGLLTPNEMALLYAKDRLQFKQILKKKLDHGLIYILDRYVHSNVFQATRIEDAGERLKFLKEFEHYELVDLGMPIPNIVLLLDMPITLSVELLKRKHKDLNESNLKYQELVRSLYLKVFDHRQELIAKNWCLIKCYETKANESNELVVRSVENIHNDVLGCLKDNINGFL